MGLSLVLLIVFGANTNVEHKFYEEMPYRIVGSGRGSYVEFITSRGEIITESSGNVISILEGHSKSTARVYMKAWYDFGNFRACEIVTVEGQRPDYQPWSNQPQKPTKSRMGAPR